MRSQLVCAVALLLASGRASAQAATAAPISDSAAFARAQVLVSAGEGKEGRAVVDSILLRIPSNTTRYAEGLFWRATLASNALDAERDYRRIAVEYVLSPRVPAALTRLAQLELARGDRTLARQHLERLLNEYPPRPERANAWYWLGRIAFESGDETRGCIAVDSARALTVESDVELVNQIAGEARRCASPRADMRAATTAPADAPLGTRSASRVATPRARVPERTSAVAARAVTIQVGAYPSRAAAEKVRKQLGTQGFTARIVPAGRYYRVRVGRYATRAAAALVVKKLKAARNDAIVVDAERAP